MRIVVGIIWRRRGASGVWNGESGETIAVTSRKMYAATPKDVKIRMMRAME
jgi:hypothetical protein